ncbi:hypothetical protein AFLA_011076 [Aspergillus flavus NRRL3357]|nr:hypothetical protein AFLA_011076 [Aspergillus flavus NRRL3357]
MNYKDNFLSEHRSQPHNADQNQEETIESRWSLDGRRATSAVSEDILSTTVLYGFDEGLFGYEIEAY